MNLRLLVKGAALSAVTFFIALFLVRGMTLLFDGYSSEGLKSLFVALMFAGLLMPRIQTTIQSDLVKVILSLLPTGKKFGVYLIKVVHKGGVNYKTRFVPWLTATYNTTWKGHFVPWVKATWSGKTAEASTWWQTKGGPKTKDFTMKYASIAADFIWAKVKLCFDWIVDCLKGKRGEPMRYAVAAILFFLLWLLIFKAGLGEVAFWSCALALCSIWAAGVLWQRDEVVNKITIFPDKEKSPTSHS